MKNRAITLLALMVSVTGYAQLYPVRGTATLTAPYSLYMADYASPVSQAMAVNLLLADENELNYQVKLRVTIQGAGITLRLKENVQVNPILLNGNIPVRLSGSDLEPYFNPQHYDFFGLTFSNFIAGGGKLPEGIYEFCFQVFDYYRDVPVSARFCASAWLLLNDPPFLNQPLNQSKVVVQNPQTIRFQWTPMHRNSPNSAFDTDYTLYIKEYTLDDVNIDPYELMGSPVRTIFTTTTEQTSFVYDIDEPALTPGKRYAFAVQAKDRSGRDMFKNQGLSEVYVFTYGDMLDPVEGIEGKALSHQEASFHWSSKPSQSRYSFRYREAGSEEWKEKDLLMNELKVSDLDANTSYEYQVRAWYGIAEGPWSETMTIKTLIGNPASDFACGATPAEWKMGNTTLLPALEVGDTVRASDFIVVLTSVTGGEGVFSGEGMIEVPFLNQHLKSEYSDPKVKLLVAFDNINVNTDHRMIVGEMKVKSGGVQVTSDHYARTISDVTTAIDVAFETVEDLLGELTALEKELAEILGLEELPSGVLAEAFSSLPADEQELVKRMMDNGKELMEKGDLEKGHNLIRDAAIHSVGKLLNKKANKISPTGKLDSLVFQELTTLEAQLAKDAEAIRSSVKLLSENYLKAIDAANLDRVFVAGLRNQYAVEGMSLFFSEVEENSSELGNVTDEFVRLNDAFLELFSEDKKLQDKKRGQEVIKTILSEKKVFSGFVEAVKNDAVLSGDEDYSEAQVDQIKSSIGRIINEKLNP